MYQISDYIDNNINGIANLLDILVNSEHDVKKLVVASSNTVYGEGKVNVGNVVCFFQIWGVSVKWGRKNGKLFVHNVILKQKL